MQKVLLRVVFGVVTGPVAEAKVESIEITRLAGRSKPADWSSLNRSP